MNISNKVMSAGILSAACFLGCAETTPKELADARVAYDRASHGPAEQWSPADLHTAHTALQKAEDAFADEGNSSNTRDLSYVALRKSQLAESHASTLAAEHQAEAAEAQVRTAQANELNSARAQLQNEQLKRADAEKRAQATMDELNRVAAVKQDERGTVITLSGSVLFQSGQSDLLPGAQTRLGQVADALTARDPDSPIVVEGYTDSQGSKRFNERLSKERAESVRSFLVSRGVAPDRIRAEGLGAQNPVADNTSAEGRANNRRVEIVVEPAQQHP
jgi:outer membrane protein OmpA-like peptidoglycan-associated protein